MMNTPEHPIQLVLKQFQALGMKHLYLSEDALKSLSPPSKQESLEAMFDSIRNCQDCKLCQGRTQVVFGAGNANAEIVFVGEGPGQDEDRQGIPFVGRAGQLLTQMIEKGMGIPREEVYICNVIKCRPPDNRNPESDEIASCEPYLKQQLAILDPKVIVALGKFAAQTLLKTTTPISRLRGSWHDYQGIHLMPTFHPSYLLRQQGPQGKEEKRKAWDDLKQVLNYLGRPIPNTKQTHS